MWLASRAGEFGAAGAEIVAVSSDSEGAAAAITESLGLPFAVLSDPDGEGAIRAYDAWHEEEGRARPALIALAPDGSEVFRHVGADQADRGSELDALRAVQELGLPARPAPAGIRAHGESRPTESAYPRGELRRHFYGVRSAANILHMRTGHGEAARLRAMAELYLEAL